VDREAHYEAVRTFYVWRVWDKDQADDLTQEVFLRVHTALPNYKPQGPFRAYLFSIATNLLIDYFRRVKARPTPRSLDQAVTESGISLLDALCDEEIDPGAGLDRAELRDALKEAMLALNDDQSAVFVLHRIEGLRYEEVADQLGIPVGTVKSRMNAAYARLREVLGRTPWSLDPGQSRSVPPARDESA